LKNTSEMKGGVELPATFTTIVLPGYLQAVHLDTDYYDTHCQPRISRRRRALEGNGTGPTTTARSERTTIRRTS